MLLALPPSFRLCADWVSQKCFKFITAIDIKLSNLLYVCVCEKKSPNKFHTIPIQFRSINTVFWIVYARFFEKQSGPVAHGWGWITNDSVPNALKIITIMEQFNIEVLISGDILKSKEVLKIFVTQVFENYV